jgi:hypothetical protein
MTDRCSMANKGNDHLQTICDPLLSFFSIGGVRTRPGIETEV